MKCKSEEKYTHVCMHKIHDKNTSDGVSFSNKEWYDCSACKGFISRSFGFHFRVFTLIFIQDSWIRKDNAGIFPWPGSFYF